MADNTVLVNMKVVSDISDVVSNVGAIQKSFSKLKLPEKLGEGLNKNIAEFYKEYDKYQKKVAEGLKTQSDYNQVEKSLNRMKTLYETIGKEASKVTKLDLESLLDLGSGDFKKIADEIANVIKQINQIKIDPSVITQQMNALRKSLKGDKFSKSGGLLDQLLGNVKTGNLAEAKKVFKELQVEVQKIMPKTDVNGDFIAKMVGKLNPTNAKAVTKALREMGAVFNATDDEIGPLNRKLDELQTELQETKDKAAGKILGDANDFNEYGKAVESVTDSLKRMHQEEFNFNRQAQDIARQVQQFFGLSQVIRKVGNIARSAFSTVKDLDKAMTETAVVTNFSVGDMWDMLPTYTAQANQLGSTIRDVYEAATLYYQQGLNTNQAMGLANETLKMARIAGLDAKDATDMMTAALRGFNMEVNQMSAQKINDVYSELAAITASDTKEIGSAMERTASIANSANMEFATTSAFLAQMIETTREAPENLGTAMKTIVARFQEMKQDPTKLIDSEGVAMDANKVDKALKTIGVQLMNTKGEFRDLDDVFLDISAKWDSLTQGQQRYIATIAAGSRQQSRFIAMMSNYERTMELVDAANNSAGASQRQFEKTLDSMEAKLNKLKNAWDQFTMGLMNNQILKFGVDFLTEGFTIVNKFIDILSKIPPKPFEGITKSILTLVSTLGLLQLGGKGAMGLTGGIFSWVNGEGFKGGFRSGWGTAGGRPDVKQSKYGDVIKANIVSSKIPQTIQREFQKGKALATATFNTGAKIITVDNLINAAELEADAKAAAQKWWNTYRAQIEAGELDFNVGLGSLNSQLSTHQIPFNIKPEEIDDEAAKITELGNEFTGLGSKITKTGANLQAFGSTLQGTPWEPFGNALIRIGNLLVNTGDLATSAGKKFKTAFEAAKKAKSEGGSGVAAFFKSFTKIPAQALIVIGLIIAMGALIHHVATQGKRDLEAAEDAAAAAADAYDSAKQEASELADAIDKIHEADSAFDNLVVGTAAFNEQLVTANEQIMELIKKYPMLNDYLTTDKNGLMHISEEGLNAVKEYQKQKQANASALNILQTNDLRAEETKQQIEALRKKDKGSSEFSVNKQSNADEIKLLEKRIEAESKSAKLNAVTTALVDKEINNREKVSAIMADQYEIRKSMVQLEGDKHDKRQQYAEFYGYNYNRSTKQMTDVEGNAIDFDDKVIADALKDIKVLADFEVDAGSVDTAISSIDKKFSKQFKGSNSFFSDILSDNIETNEDLLREVFQNPGKLQDAVDTLSSKEIAAVLGVSADAVEVAPDTYNKQLVDKLTEKSKNIIETQAQAWGEFGAMLAQSEGMQAEALLEGRKTTTDFLQNQLTQFTAEQRDLMLSVGKSLESGAGIESMKTFINTASDIYRYGTENAIDELNNLTKNVNWESPIARLKAYNNLTKASTPEIAKMGRELLKSADSANLLGEAFEEFYNSSDWTELSENMDKFVDSTGKVNASAVQEMAKECHSLNNLLDTGAISAGGVAAAINALGSSGDLTLLDLNSNVLKLLSSFNQLDDAIASAHQSIENFDWGIDTGEAEDFAKESAKKWNELYKNQEYGNPQLEAYAKYILGEEKYIKMLNKNGGDLEATMNKVATYVNRYADGFNNAWESIAGGKWQKDGIQKKLAKAGLDDKGIKMFTEGDRIIWEPGTATTDELVKWLQTVEGVSEEWAKVMLEDWENYSPDFRAERQKNDFNAGLKEGGYISEHRDALGGVTITRSELETIAQATGQKVEEVQSAIAEAAGIDKDKLNIIENFGDKALEIPDLIKEYNKSITGKENESWISKLITENEGQKRIAADEAITQAIGDGFTQNQAEQMAYEELSKAVAEGTDVWYKDKLLTPEDLSSFDNFKNAIQEFEDNKQWIQVGEAIAQGVINFINKNESGEGKEPNTQPDTQPDNQNRGRPSKADAYDNRDTPKTNQESGLIEQIRAAIKAESDARQEQNQNATGQSREELQESNKNFWTGVKDWFSQGGWQGPQNTETPDTAAPIESAATQLDSSAQLLTTAGESLNTGVTTLTTAGDTLNTAGSNLTNAAAILAASQSGGQGSGEGNQGPVNTTSSVSGAIVVDNSAAMQSLGELKQLAEETKELIDTGATFTVNIEDGGLSKAGANAKKITDAASGTNSIKVETGEVNTQSVDEAKAKIENTEAKIPVGATDKTSNTIKTIVKGINDKSATLDVYMNQAGNWTVNIKSNSVPGNAKGRNNKITSVPLPSFGSAAKGRYGTVGPKNRGGLTLTGEKGYEIVWLPNESKSMVVGVGGPQMINLPDNAVVYTHEQSKDIFKRKSIDAGSHSSKPRKQGGNGGGGSSSSSKSKSKKSRSKKSKSSTKNINNFSIEEVVRFNIDQKLTKLADQIENRTKTIEKTLAKIGTRYDDIAKTSQDQVKSLQAAAEYQKNLYESNKRQLADYRKQKEIVNYTTSAGKSATKTINVSTYLNADGSINQAAIQKLSTKAEREAVYKQVSGVAKGLVDGMNSAKKAMEDYNQKIAELSKQISESFYQWENELTEIYDLTQRISNETSLTDRFSSQVSLELSKLNAGFGKASDSIDVIRKVLARNNDTIREQVENQQQMVNARRRELELALSANDELDKLGNFYQLVDDNVAKAANIEWMEGQLAAVVGGQKYLKNLQQGLDGSIKYEIDWEQFNKDNEANPYEKNTYEAIKQYLDKLNESVTEYNNAIKEQTDFIKETYDALREYQNTVSDFEETLISGVEALNKTEIENAKKLSSSISDSLKDLLDEVKRKLDERRKQEDNRKTEQDIAQKQQQLAALRANTAGGNQVQIAQLEKEIAEAQQSYQRTLEDQLLDKLQQQGDEAAKQRERLIALSEGQLNIAASTNKEIVDIWLKDPENFENEIKEAWLAANNYDEKGEVGQYLLDQAFKSEFANLVTAVEQSGFINGFEGVKENTNILVQLLTDLNNNLIGREDNDQYAKDFNAQSDVTTRNTETLLEEVSQLYDISKAHDEGIGAASLRKIGYGAKELSENGYTPSELKSGGYTAQNFKDEGLTLSQGLAAGFNAKQLKDVGYDVPYKDMLSYIASKGTLTAADFKDIQEVANKEGKSAKTYMQNLADIDSPKNITWAQVIKAAKDNGFSKYRIAITFSSKAFQTGYDAVYGKGAYTTNLAYAKKKGYTAYAYATGGLAKQTGPAWLDGTPSKPELVLNAKDTKNFIALKDILSKAMGSTSAVNNTYGNATYEININVDHLANDYDVDKVAQRVKKIIVDDSSYRNVTQVRKFR